MIVLKFIKIHTNYSILKKVYFILNIIKKTCRVRLLILFTLNMSHSCLSGIS